MNTTLIREDALRLKALEQYEALGEAPDPALIEITSLAAQICDTPMAALSLVAADTVHMYARIGAGPAQVARGRTPCETCIQGDEVYEIPDARYHADFRPDGIMISGRAYRFYAGAPLVTPAGVRIGCLFVQDSVPHRLNDKQRQALLMLSRQVINRFELNRRVRDREHDAQLRLHVENALMVERNFVSTVLDTVGALVAVFDTAGRIVRFNRACEQISGFSFPSLAGRFAWEMLIPPAEIPTAIETFERLREGPFPAHFENQWRHRDGSLHRIEWTTNALVDSQGETDFIIATGIDITGRREAEATLRESEARYRQLIEGSLGMVCTHDLSGILLSVNAHGAANLGHTVDEMIGQDLKSFLPEERRAAFSLYLREVTDNGEAQGRLQMCDRDGNIRTLAFRNKRIDVPGRRSHVLGFGVDISEQVRATSQLRTLIHQSNSILDSVGDGIYGIDLAGRVTVINPAAAQMLGYKPHELLGRNFHEIVHHTRADGTTYPARECPINGTLHHLDTIRITNEIFWRKDGSSFPVEYVARPQIELVEAPPPPENAGKTGKDRPDGRIEKAVGVVVAFTDTTERRALDRMKDEFISTVSHELRTPLTSLRAALGLITGGALTDRPEKMDQMLEMAIGNTDRLIRLVNDILDLESISSGSTQLHSIMCSADALLQCATSLQQGEALKQGLRFNIETDGVQIWADPDRILQAMANLISNAIKFSSYGGVISLTARQVDDHEAQIDIHNQGSSIPDDKLEDIFERFQQGDASDSRPIGGTGLGLTICRRIVTQHGGRIWASSPLDQGPTFSFTLPTHPSSYLR